MTTDSAKQAKKLATIERLLAKAESTTPEEAEALTEAAERLMIRYGIDQAMLESQRDRAEGRVEGQIVQKSMRYDGVYAQGLRDLAHLVITAYPGTRMLVNGTSEHWTCYVIGYEADVDQVMLLVRSLELQAATAMAAWWRTFTQKAYLSDHYKQKAKRQFLASFGRGAADRINFARREAVSDTPGSELMLRDRKAQVDDWIAETYKTVKPGRRTTASPYGREEGHAAGLRANTGERGVGAGRKAVGR